MHACLVIIRVKSVVANYSCGSEVYVSLPQDEEAWIEAFHTIAIDLYYIISAFSEVYSYYYDNLFCISLYLSLYQLLKSMFYTLAPSLCIHAMIALSNVFCIIVLCSAVIIYKKVIELLASTCATQVARGK